MSYTKQELAKKLIDIYPEITQHNLDLSLEFNDDKNAWVIDLKKGTHDLKTHLEKLDADECMNGVKCIYLGVQIGQFVQNFENDQAKIDAIK